MKKQVIQTSLIVKKQTIAQLNDKKIEAIKGGSTIATSALAALCRTINPLDCSMSAFCAY